MEFISGCIKSILEKYADPTIEKSLVLLNQNGKIQD